MKKIMIITCVLALSTACVGIPLCSSEENTKTAAELIKEAKTYIQEGNKEKAIATLDTAFELANKTGGYEELMEIGDLYIAIDTSLSEKAMKAWTAAGCWKCR